MTTLEMMPYGENKQITDLLPGILNQLGAESLTHLKKLASNVPTADGADDDAGNDADDDDDVPDLVENFDEASKNEAKESFSPCCPIEDADDESEGSIEVVDKIEELSIDAKEGESVVEKVEEVVDKVEEVVDKVEEVADKVEEVVEKVEEVVDKVEEGE